ncbi:esterase FE4-like [Choristoneura fumiferana]|uniref:esterase FE4-like n=1 Tax=Choristoneura fumiferana TaxID=7141 RepID=UPI003D159D3F
MTYPVTVARNYAKKLGFDSDDVEELAKFYREAPVDQLLNQSLNFVNMDDGELGFGVCVERPVPGVERLVPRAPALLLPANARPALFTYCDDESSIKAADLVKKNREYNENFPIFMPANLDFPSDEIKYAVSNETRSFYFGNGTITAASRAAFGDFWADRQYVYQAAYCAAEQAARAPAFLLEFTYEGGLSEKKPEPAARGAGHPDFFNYLMPPKEVDDEDDLRIVKEITTIVADFVKTGHAWWPAAEPGLSQVWALRVGRGRAAPTPRRAAPRCRPRWRCGTGFTRATAAPTTGRSLTPRLASRLLKLNRLWPG